MRPLAAGTLFGGLSAPPVIWRYTPDQTTGLAGGYDCDFSQEKITRNAGGLAYLSLRLGNKVQTMPYIPALPSHLPRQMEVLVSANPRIKSLFAKNNIVFANFTTIHNYT